MKQACGEHRTLRAMIYRLSIVKKCMECDQEYTMKRDIHDHIPNIMYHKYHTLLL